MLCRYSRGDHANRIMKERLHWLRIPQRIQFKLCLLVYKSLHGTAPTYLSELVNQINTNDARRRLRSATIGDLIVSRTRTNFGQHAFAWAYRLEQSDKSVRSASSIASFKKETENSLFQFDLEIIFYILVLYLCDCCKFKAPLNWFTMLRCHCRNCHVIIIIIRYFCRFEIKFMKFIKIFINSLIQSKSVEESDNPYRFRPQ